MTEEKVEDLSVEIDIASVERIQAWLGVDPLQDNADLNPELIPYTWRTLDGEGRYDLLSKVAKYRVEGGELSDDEQHSAFRCFFTLQNEVLRQRTKGTNYPVTFRMLEELEEKLLIEPAK